ncbi:MAG: methyltransferase [Bacteroidota bacterium]
MYENTYPNKRFKHTLAFLQKHIGTAEPILDLGVDNPFSQIMRNQGYAVENTNGEDLDLNFESIRNSDADVVTAFEIFEHLVAPFNVLREIQAKKLVASIPLRLWFSPAYKSETDAWDRHYHEFEDWQFNWLLEKSGWQIKDSKKFANPIKKIGVRPLLRSFTPRYYLVYAVKNSK